MALLPTSFAFIGFVGLYNGNLTCHKTAQLVKRTLNIKRANFTLWTGWFVEHGKHGGGEARGSCGVEGAEKAAGRRHNVSWRAGGCRSSGLWPWTGRSVHLFGLSFQCCVWLRLRNISMFRLVAFYATIIPAARVDCASPGCAVA